MTRLAFVDVETTGLDPERHEVWEVGLIIQDDAPLAREYLWQLPVDLSRADPIALEIGGFRERYGLTPLERRTGWSEPFDQGPPSSIIESFVDKFGALTHGAHLVGMAVSFDAERLARLMRRYDQAPTWHYHVIDVEALIAGRYGIAPPWRSTDLSQRVGIDPDVYDRHTALGDARWAQALYFAAMEHTDG